MSALKLIFLHINANPDHPTNYAIVRENSQAFGYSPSTVSVDVLCYAHRVSMIPKNRYSSQCPCPKPSATTIVYPNHLVSFRMQIPRCKLDSTYAILSMI